MICITLAQLYNQSSHNSTRPRKKGPHVLNTHLPAGPSRRPKKKNDVLPTNSEHAIPFVYVRPPQKSKQKILRSP